MTQVLPKKPIFSPDTSREMLFALPSTLNPAPGHRAAGTPAGPPRPSLLLLPGPGGSWAVSWARRAASSSLQLTPYLGPQPLCICHLPLKEWFQPRSLFKNACLLTHNSHLNSGLETPSLAALLSCLISAQWSVLSNKSHSVHVVCVVHSVPPPPPPPQTQCFETKLPRLCNGKILVFCLWKQARRHTGNVYLFKSFRKEERK